MCLAWYQLSTSHAFFYSVLSILKMREGQVVELGFELGQMPELWVHCIPEGLILLSYPHAPQPSISQAMSIVVFRVCRAPLPSILVNEFPPTSLAVLCSSLKKNPGHTAFPSGS